MRKNSFIKLVGFALAASLALTGCDSNGDSTPVDDGGTGMATTTGGGTTTAATTGGTTTTTTGTTTGATTGFGLTGGTMTGGFGGSGSGTTTTGGTTGATTGTTTGTTTGGTTSPSFLNPVVARDNRTGLNNPTGFTAANAAGRARAFVVDGFQLGQSNGRLVSPDLTGAFDPTTGGFPLQVVTASADSTVSANLNSPFDVVSDGTSLYISVGFGFPQDGAIIRVSNFTETNGVLTAKFESITTNAAFTVNPAFLTLVGSSAGNFVYWTEYSSAQVSGRVRRVRTDGTGTVDDIITNLNFPAGLDHDGVRLAVCDSSGGGQSLGRIIVTDIFPTTTLNAANPADVTEITPVQGEAAIRRPFDVVSDGANGFFFTEGAALPFTSAPTPLGPGNGVVRFIPRTGTEATIVNSGLTNAAGIDAIDSNRDGVVSVLFSESIDSTGTILRRSVDTNNIVQTNPTQADSGLFSPLTVGILSETTPSFIGIINYDGGQSNGVFRSYAP